MSDRCAICGKVIEGDSFKILEVIEGKTKAWGVTHSSCFRLHFPSAKATIEELLSLRAQGPQGPNGRTRGQV